MRLTAGQQAPDFTWTDLHGQTHQLSRLAGQPVLLAFHRYASCPLCNLHMHGLIARYPALDAAGLKILTIFQSSDEVITRNVGRQDAPFPILADPNKQLYGMYGVEGSAGGVLRGATRLGDLLGAARLGFLPGELDGDVSMVPADFLVGPDQRLHSVYYGADVGDHMPFAQIEAYARTWRGAP
jgi:peroxiredoxin